MRVEAARWLWYPGDLEKYHAMVQNFSRVERVCPWPAFWKSDGFRQRVVFRRCFCIERETSFVVYGNPGALGYVQAGEKKHPFGARITLAPG